MKKERKDGKYKFLPQKVQFICPHCRHETRKTITMAMSDFKCSKCRKVNTQ